MTQSSLFSLDQTTGYFPFKACRFDRRFAYGVYVPRNYKRETADQFRILAVIHGSERAPEVVRALSVKLAEEKQCVVLTPLFPAAVTEDDEIHNYIFLKYQDIRFDLVLLAMVAEVVERFGVSAHKIWMSGFSGGGQFVHRFMYLHASRLGAVSIGAPGIINTLDESADWFVGIRDVRSKFGLDIDWQGMKNLPVQLVVGDKDIGTDIVISPPTELYMPGVNDTGLNRVERTRYLFNILNKFNSATRLDIVPNAEHSAEQVQLAVDRFFSDLTN